MKLIKKLRKGFTLIELVVVIAVIAILSAVTVVSYIAITNRAKQSVDEQAVAQMNTVLRADGVLAPTSIDKLYAVLEENGLDAKNYTPLLKDRYFFWCQEDNTIIYAEAKNGDYVGIFPAEYKGQTKGNNHWLSLNGAIEEKAVSKGANDTYTVSKAEELYYLSKNNKVAAGDTIKLDTQNLDLMGADVSFSFSAADDFTIQGSTEEGGTKVTGLVQNEQKMVATDGGNNNDNAGKSYYCGFVGEVRNGAQVTISNITLDGVVVGDLETGSVGAIAGFVGKKPGSSDVTGAKLILDNVHIVNSVVNGKNKVGGFVGAVTGGSVEINSNCTIKDTAINCSEGEAAKFVGSGYGGAVISVPADLTATNVTVNLVDGKLTREKIDISSVESGTIGETAEPVSATTLVAKLDQNQSTGEFAPSGKYRMFYKDAKVLFFANSAANKFNNAAVANKVNNLVISGKTVAQYHIAVL